MGFKVIIAGGSVAGLALANMLEQNGIDYLVLEKREIAPAVGASIAILPNGARILDQLGCWDPLVSDLKDDDMFQHTSTRNTLGKEIFKCEDFQGKLRKRAGYGFVFIDRQTLVQTLYNNIKDKSKVLVNKGISRVEQNSSGVIVLTKDGESFEGSILVGADGVHSAVRREMWRIADAESPGYFSQEERRNAPCNYSCVFGISKVADDARIDSSYHVQGDGHSHLINTGPNGKIYWFLSKRLKETSHGLYENLPRYTDAQRDELAAEHLDDMIVDEVGLTFGKLWDTRTSATLTALPEYVMSKWHYGRITTVGDSVHKFNPIAGQGGNSAFETCAVLTNRLHGLLKAHTEHDPSSEAIADIFEQVRNERFDRAVRLEKVSATQQEIQAHETLGRRLFNRFVLPFVNVELPDLIWKNSKGAARLETLEVPSRERTAMFDDETPPSKGEVTKTATMMSVLAVSGIAISAALMYKNAPIRLI